MPLSLANTVLTDNVDEFRTKTNLVTVEVNKLGQVDNLTTANTTDLTLAVNQLDASAMKYTANTGSNVSIDSATFVIDTTNNRVGVGNTAPLDDFEVFNASDPGISVRTPTQDWRVKQTGSTLTIRDETTTTDRYTITTAGVHAVTGNVAFDTDTLFVDATNDRVGINKIPTVDLEVLNAGAVAEVKVLSGGIDSLSEVSIENDAKEWKLQTTGVDAFTIRDETGTTDRYSISTTGTHSVTGNVAFDVDTVMIDASNDRLGVGRTPTVDLDVYNATTPAEVKIQSGGVDSVAELSLENDAKEYKVQTTGADAFVIRDETGTTDRYTISSAGEHTITGNTTVTLNMVVSGNLTVSGTTTTVNTSTFTAEDNIILLNSGEPGAVVTEGIAGIEIDRGTGTNYQLLFDDSVDRFEVGMAGSLQAVATREDTPTDNGFAFWDTATLKFETSANLLYDGSTLTTNGLQVNGTITQGIDGTGYDTTLYSAAAGAFFLWDESANQLQLRGATAAGPGHLLLSTGETTTVAADVLGRIDFQAPVDAAGTDAILVAASIYAEAGDTFSATVNDTDLVFATGVSETAVERLRIDADGLNIPTGDDYSINGVSMLSSTALGTSVVSSSLTSVGTLTGLSMGGNIVMGDNSATGMNTITFTDVNGTIAGIENQNLLDKTAIETISAAWTHTGAITVGVDDTGHDVLMYGASAGAFGLWDESADKLELRGATAAGPGSLLLSTGELSVAGSDVLGQIDFQAPVDASGSDAILVAASIYAEAGSAFSTVNNDTDLVFATAFSELAAEKMRLDGAGRLGINTTTAQSLLDVRGDAGAAGILTLSTAETTTVDGDKLGQIDFQAPEDAAGTDAILVAASIWAEANATFSASVNDTDLVFATAASEVAAEKMRLSAAGDLTVASGGNINITSGALQFAGTSIFSGTHTWSAAQTFSVTPVFSSEVNFANGIKAAKQAYFDSTTGGTLTPGATIAWNLTDKQVTTITLDGSANVFSAPTNMKNGGTYILAIKQDSTGSRTATWNSVFKWPSGTAPVLTTTPTTGFDLLTFYCDGTNLYGNITANFL